MADDRYDGDGGGGDSADKPGQDRRGIGGQNYSPHRRRVGDQPTEIEPSVVEIPGTFRATYDDGTITGWVFMPSASYAGYFGPAAILVEGDDELDILETDGPFWHAVQAALGDTDAQGRIGVDWQE